MTRGPPKIREDSKKETSKQYVGTFQNQLMKRRAPRKEKLFVTIPTLQKHGGHTTSSSSFWRKRGDGFLLQSNCIPYPMRLLRQKRISSWPTPSNTPIKQSTHLLAVTSKALAHTALLSADCSSMQRSTIAATTAMANSALQNKCRLTHTSSYRN